MLKNILGFRWLLFLTGESKMFRWLTCLICLRTLDVKLVFMTAVANLIQVRFELVRLIKAFQIDSYPV